MVKIKKKSKRISTRRRATIDKKVRDHNRKMKREAKKNPHKKKKDPGIPNSLPFKYDILMEGMQQKQRLEEQRAKIKERRKKERAKLLAQKRHMDNNVGRNLQMMVSDAEKKQKAFEKSKKEAADSADYSVTNSKPVESSVKTYYKEFRKVVESADVVLEVLDARDPLGSRCAEVEQTVLASGSKRLVLVLNKIDLVPKENVQKWLKYLRNEFPAIAFKASTQSQADNLSHKKLYLAEKKDNLMKSSGCLGAELLLKLLGSYCHEKDIKKMIYVGVVGFPNTGKSSIINSLKRSRVCNVGAQPGVTKTLQAVQLDKHISLLDSPGVVMSSGQSDVAAVLRNVVKLENLADPSPAVEAILKRCNKEQMMMHYSLPSYKDVHEFLALLARRLGKLRKGGVPDVTLAGRTVLKDWTSGKITYYTHPPEQSELPTHVSAQLCNDLGREFQLEDIEKEELTILQGLDPCNSHFMEVESLGPAHGIASEDDLLALGDMQTEKTEDSESLEKEEESMENSDQEDDGAMTETTVILPAKAERSKAKVDLADMENMSAAGTGDNKQLNKIRQQQYKVMKKKRKRADKVAVKLSDALASAFALKPDEDSDGDYNFSEHFKLT